MKMTVRQSPSAQTITRQEHLWVQKMIEKRAYALWVSAGCNKGTSLRDWIDAEKEVLTDFCRRKLRPPGGGGISTKARAVTASTSKLAPRQLAVYFQSVEFPPMLYRKSA
jgi:hypothetical protein